MGPKLAQDANKNTYFNVKFVAENEFEEKRGFPFNELNLGPTRPKIVVGPKKRKFFQIAFSKS